MKLFLSSIEKEIPWQENGIKPRWSLMSYYYIIRGKMQNAIAVRDASEEVLIDSGAYTYQRNAKGIDWVQYTKEYANFIKEFDRPNVIGYFEMDIDILVGYEKVKELRAILEATSDKIIPVWHKNRGIDDFKEMCQKYKIVSISGIENKDIEPKDYMKFVNYAHKCGCKIHCLGMAKQSILNKVPFDYVDTASWKVGTAGGMVASKNGVFSQSKKTCKHLSSEMRKNTGYMVMVENYKRFQRKSNEYYLKWKKYEEKLCLRS